jgi:hypothetical protein
MNSKNAFRNTFRLTNGERPVFIPFVYGLAAKISQIPLEEMVADAGYYTHSLEDTRELFKYDGIVNNFDATIEAEAFGCEVAWSGDYDAPRVNGCRQAELREVRPEDSHRIQVLLETTKRIVMSKGKDVAVVGNLTGPVSLAKALTDDKNGGIETVIPLAGNLLMKLVRSLCDLRVDAIFFREDIIGADYRDRLLAHQAPYTAIYTTLFNLVKHYNGYAAVIVRDMQLDFIPELHRMIGPSGLILLGQKVSDDGMALLQELSGSLKIAFGLPLPVQNRDEVNDRIALVSRFVSLHRPTGFFYVSDGEIPGDTPAEVLHELIDRIQNT